MQLWQRVRARKLTRRDNVLASVILVLVLVGLMQINYQCDWTGFGVCQFPNGLENGYRPEKTLWDWLGLLIIPAVLALGAVYFNRAERQIELRIAEQRAQDALLQTYLDQMTELLLVGKLRDSKAGDEVRHVAQVRTLIALRRLDRERRAILMQFLWASQLVGIDEKDMIVDFRGVDLSNVDLSATPMYSISMQGANLYQANLRRANLDGAFLMKTDLRGANLEWAKFRRADLREANLDGANIQRASLDGANLEGTNLRRTKLEGASFIGASLDGANLYQANLDGAFLIGANLRGAKLGGANIQRASLDGAFLTGTDLRGANLKDARVTQQQLESAYCLDDVVMPDGSKVTQTNVK